MRTNETLTTAILFRILGLAPMGESEAKFKALAAKGDPTGFYAYYETCMKNYPELDEKIERDGQISFRMLKPAMDAVFMVRA